MDATERALDRISDAMIHIVEMIGRLLEKTDAQGDRRDGHREELAKLGVQVTQELAKLATQIALLASKLDEARDDIKENTGSFKLVDPRGRDLREGIPEVVADDPTTGITAHGIKISWPTVTKWTWRVVPIIFGTGVGYLIHFLQKFAH
jgi:hypothetical protein